MQLLRYISEVLHTIGKPTRLLLNIKEHDLSQTRLSYTPMCIHTHTHNTLTSTPTTPSSTLPQRTHVLPYPYPHPQHPHIHINHTLIHTSSTHPPVPAELATVPAHFLNAPTNAPTRPCRACSPTTALVALLSRVACGSIRSDTLEENTLEEIH